MSDDGDDFMQDSEEEYDPIHVHLIFTVLKASRYDFEFEDDGEEDNADVDIENKYYNAKQTKVTNPEDAIDEFLGVPALEEEKSEWGFKGLKQAIKLEFKLGRYEKVFQFPLDIG